MPAYRAIRPGDLLAVRTDDPYDDTEHQVVLHSVTDTGAALLMAGTWRGKNLEVLIRRVGSTEPLDN
jgi:hypothetical protein